MGPVVVIYMHRQNKELYLIECHTHLSPKNMPKSALPVALILKSCAAVTDEFAAMKKEAAAAATAKVINDSKRPVYKVSLKRTADVQVMKVDLRVWEELRVKACETLSRQTSLRMTNGRSHTDNRGQVYGLKKSVSISRIRNLTDQITSLPIAGIAVNKLRGTAPDTKPA